MVHRPCLDCGALSRGSRCPTHTRERERADTRAKRARRPYGAAEAARRAAVVKAWREEHGDWCPGYERPAHASSDLTADHYVPVGAGAPESGPLGVLCRSCNGRKGARLG